MQMNKARNLIEHRDEIKSRPIKTFIKAIKSKDSKKFVYVFLTTLFFR